MTNLSAEQQQVAQTIISVGKQRGEPDANIVIALMTGLTESGLRNLNYGDRDSVGVFQQRSNWGSVATRENVAASAGLFYDALDKVNQSGNPWMIAQRVQISSFSDGSNYRANYSQAQAIYAEYGGGVVKDPSPAAAITSPSNVFETLTHPTFWARVGLGALGGILLGIALVKLLGNTSGGSKIIQGAQTVAQKLKVE